MLKPKSIILQIRKEDGVYSVISKHAPNNDYGVKDINDNDDDPMPQDNGDNKHGTR